jgi:hypothetical protein
MNTEVLLTKANRAIKFRRKEAKSSSNIAGELKLFLRSVASPARRNVSVPDAFEQIAGDGLAQNCRIESLTAGVMKVKVKSGPYMFELRTRAGQIIEQLKQQCPSSNIREIKLVCSE